jgi:hypothetical protein
LKVLVLAVGMSGCATTAVVKVGPATGVDHEVGVFASEREVGTTFEVLAIVHSVDPGKFRVMTLADVLPRLQAEARAVGADALIIDEVQSTKAGLISTGISVRARAIRLALKPT